MSDRKVSVITGTTTNHYYTVWTQPTVIQCGGTLLMRHSLA